MLDGASFGGEGPLVPVMLPTGVDRESVRDAIVERLRRIADELGSDEGEQRGP